MTNSRQKGKVGEREFCHWLIDRGYPAHRSQQYCGADGDADVTTAVDGLLFIDVKRVETLQLHKAMAQVISDAAGTGRVPVVMQRRNRGEWVAILRADDLIKLLADKLPPPEAPPCSPPSTTSTT